MLWAILISLLLLLVFYLLFVPIIFRIDTDAKQYFIQVKGLMKAELKGDKEQLIKLRLKILFLHFNFFPLKYKKQTKTKKPAKSSSRSRRSRFGFRKIIRLFRSFRIRQFSLNVDTGDPILNAKLYPVFGFLNHRYGGFEINFQNRNRLVLEIQNRPIYILKSFINI